MNPFEFVIAIVILTFLYKIVTSSLESKRENRQARQEESTESDSDGLQRLAELEERVRVLERIVTDEQFELRQRFRNL